MKLSDKNTIELHVESIQDSVESVKRELSDLLEIIQNIEVEDNE